MTQLKTNRSLVCLWFNEFAHERKKKNFPLGLSGLPLAKATKFIHKTKTTGIILCITTTLQYKYKDTLGRV